MRGKVRTMTPHTRDVETGMAVPAVAMVATVSGKGTLVWQLYSYQVLDARSESLGAVDQVWTDSESSIVKFIGIRTGWVRGQTHVVPAGDARIDPGSRSIHVGYSRDKIRGAPSHNSPHSLSSDQERKVYAYYDKL